MVSYLNKSPITIYFQGRYIARSSRGLHLLRTRQPSSLEAVSSVIKHTFTRWRRLRSIWLTSCLSLDRILMGSMWQRKTALDFGETRWIRSDWLFENRICHCIKYLWTNAPENTKIAESSSLDKAHSDFCPLSCKVSEVSCETQLKLYWRHMNEFRNSEWIWMYPIPTQS